MDGIAIGREIVVRPVMIPFSSNTSEISTMPQLAIHAHSEPTSAKSSFLTRILIDMSEASEAAGTLLELRRKSLNSETSELDFSKLAFEDLRPEHFVPTSLFTKFNDDHRLSEILLAMTVMVISFLDLPVKIKFQSCRQKIVQLALIGHLESWYYHVNSPNVKKETESYLLNQGLNLSFIRFSTASKDAKGLIAKMKNFVKTGVREPLNLGEFISRLYQQILLQTMRFSLFYNEPYYLEPDFRTIIEKITILVISRVTDRLLMDQPQFWK